MSRALVAFLAAFEAVITAAIGIGVALAPLTVVWAVQYHMQLAWSVFWRAAADAWLLGLGVNLRVDVDRTTALGLGLPGAVPPFTVTIAALGVALFTVAMGARVGRRAAETRFLLTGAIASIAAFTVTAWAVAATAAATPVGPVVADVIPVAGITFGAGVVLGIGLDWARNRDDVPWWFARVVGPEVRVVLGAALRAAIGAVALLLAAAALFITLLLFTHFGKAVALYEGLQAGYLGGATLTLAQLAFLPNAVLWAMSWLIGPGFALGGAVAPGSELTTQLPGVPLLAIVPSHTPAGAFVCVAVPVLLAAASGFLAHRTLADSTPRRDGVLDLALTAAGAAVFGGVVLGVLAWWSSGTLAPGALAHLGPNPWAVGGIGALELGVGAAIGLAVAYFRDQALDWTAMVRPKPEPEASVPEPDEARV
ncbi:MAG TPA: DUF6350 family protein [Gryllotalpicola sp.]